MKLAKRIESLPPYLFAEIDSKIAEKKAQGIDVISLGIGDPVEATPPHIVERLCAEAADPLNHRYPDYYGLAESREAIASWFKQRFNVDLEHKTQVLPLIGSKEGIAHIFLAIVDPGDYSLVPGVGYPVYQTGTLLAGGMPYFIDLKKENGFLPDLDQIDGEIASRAKLMFISYPNNPTTAIATPEFFAKVVEFAKKHDLLVCHDNAYSEIYFDGYTPPSFLETPGAMEVGVEFHSLSKTYNMTGWRIGFAVGNPQAIEALGRVKTNIDSGIFNAIQRAGIAALSGPQACVEEMRQIYRRRRDLVFEALGKIGLQAEKPLATIYVWVEVPDGFTSASFATYILEKAGVVVSPGNAYGPSGEGFIRISLTVKEDRLTEALERISQSL